MSTNSFPLCRRGISIGYWSIILMAAILFFAQLLPQFLAAGYKEVIPLLSTSQTLIKWGFPILQVSLAAGVALLMSAPQKAKVLPWGIACLTFTACVFLWPSVVYMLNLSNSWLASGLGGFGSPSIVPCIQAWLFSGMLLKLSAWGQAESTQHPASLPQAAKLKNEWSKPVSGLHFVLWAGGLLLAVWFVLYYLPILIPPLSLYYVRYFRLLMWLPQVGTFILMLLLGAFAGRAYPINRLLKSLSCADDSDLASTESTTIASQKESNAAIAWGMFGLVLLSIGSYLASQRLLAPQYASKQLNKSKAFFEDFNRRFQEANKELVSSIGTAAPNLQMESLQGDSITLESLRGKVVLLNFWETTKIPSTAEIPSLELIYNEKSVDGIAVIGISPEPKPTLEAFVRSKKVTYPIVSGSNWQPPFHQLSTKPITYVIDRQGIIRVRLVGMQGYTKLKSAIEQALLAEGKPVEGETKTNNDVKDPLEVRK
ncbi:MAG: TlpA family protein disulfide reductase [Planctomycetota bacterium]